MGFLDRLRGSANEPDAFTIEVMARVRALPNVEVVEAIDADTIAVTWAGSVDPTPTDLADLRPRWKKATGFDRIELLDDFIAGLSPGDATVGTASTSLPDPGPSEPAIAGPADAGPPDDAPSPPESWAAVQTRVLPVLRRAGAEDGTVVWPVGSRLEAAAIVPGAPDPLRTVQCEAWGIGVDEVRGAATANLGDIDPAPEPVGPGARAWVATKPPGQQSAWLANPARFLQRIGLQEAIALAPLPGELVVVDPADTDLVRSILTSTIRIVEEQPTTLCPVPFLVAVGSVTEWEPAADHPAAELVARIRALSD